MSCQPPKPVQERMGLTGSNRSAWTAGMIVRWGRADSTAAPAHRGPKPKGEGGFRSLHSAAGGIRCANQAMHGRVNDMHVNALDIALASVIVAALAVVASLVTTVIAVRGQRALAREQHFRRQTAKTYLQLLSSISGYREGSIDAALAALPAMLSARMMAYASPGVYQAWTVYIVETKRYENTLRGPDAALSREVFPQLEKSKDRLIQLVRTELGNHGAFTLSQVERVPTTPSTPSA